MVSPDAIRDQIKELIFEKNLDYALDLTLNNLSVLGINADTYSTIGIIYFQKGDIPAARYMFKLGILINPQHLDALYNLAVLEYTQENLLDSLEFLKLFKKYCITAEDNQAGNQLILDNVERLHKGTPQYSIKQKTFLDMLVYEMILNVDNQYYDNLDYDVLNISSPDAITHNQISNTTQIHKNIEGLTYLFNLLSDVPSKELLVKVLAYKLMGHHKIKLPLNNPNYWSERESLKALQDENDSIRINFKDWVFNMFNLERIGYPVRMYNSTMGIQITFMQKQYEHPYVKAEQGDYVIDAGGCYGDTALYFAHHVGEAGKVFTFEFIDSNLEIMQKNLILNETLQNRITVVNRPLWEESDHEMYYLDFGPASRISSVPFNNYNKTVTISIDDYVKTHHVPKVDFIKMDIEGAELSALKGARETITKYHPKLAICLYHNIEDFSTVIEYISSLNIPYQYYLGHYTIFDEETLLYAVPVEC